MWPEGFKAALAIGIDDAHPESSLDGSDCGGDLDAGALGLLRNFLEKYSNLKATLFVTPCHIFLPQIMGVERLHSIIRVSLRRKGREIDNICHRFLIKKIDAPKFDIDRNVFFSRYLRSLTAAGQIKVGIHGCFHFHSIPPYASEFRYLDEKEASRRIKLAIYKMTIANVPFVKGFSPPGWGVNKTLLKVLDNEEFSYIAGSADFSTPITRNSNSMEAGLKNISLVFPSLVTSRLVNVPRNWTLHNNLKRALKILDLGGLLSIHMHVENEYHGSFLGNGITAKNVSKLERLIDIIISEYGKSIWFSTFDEVARSF